MGNCPTHRSFPPEMKHRHRYHQKWSYSKGTKCFKTWFWVSIIHVSFIPIGGAHLVAFQKYLAWGSIWNDFREHHFHMKNASPYSISFLQHPFFPLNYSRQNGVHTKKTELSLQKWSSHFPLNNDCWTWLFDPCWLRTPYSPWRFSISHHS